MINAFISFHVEIRFPVRVCPEKRGKGFSEVLSGDILFTHEFTRLPIQLIRS